MTENEAYKSGTHPLMESRVDGDEGEESRCWSVLEEKMDLELVQHIG